MEKDYNERQKQIIHSAIDLIGSKGIQGLTIKNLSAEVGVAESAIYRHFDSKTQVIYAVLSYLRNNIVKKYSAILNKKLKPVEKLKQLMQQHLEFFKENPSLSVVLFSDGMYKNEPELTQAVISIMQFVKTSYIYVLDEARENSSIRKDITSEYLSFIIMGSIRLTINQWSLSGFSYNLTVKGDELWKVIHKIVVSR